MNDAEAVAIARLAQQDAAYDRWLEQLNAEVVPHTLVTRKAWIAVIRQYDGDILLGVFPTEELAVRYAQQWEATAAASPRDSVYIPGVPHLSREQSMAAAEPIHVWEGSTRGP